MRLSPNASSDGPARDRDSDSHSESERTLILRAQRGDVAAFETLFRRYWAPLCIFAFRYTKQRDAAQDVVADVFSRLWDTRETWNVRVSIKAYLYAAVRRRALNVVRHDKVVSTNAESFPDSAENVPPVDEQLIHEETVAAIRTQIDTLPERMRIIATLRWYDRLSHAEIAETLNLPLRSVTNRLTYTLNLLRARLRER